MRLTTFQEKKVDILYNYNVNNNTGANDQAMDAPVIIIIIIINTYELLMNMETTTIN